MIFPDPITYCLIWGEDYQATGNPNFDNDTALVNSVKAGTYRITWEAWLSVRWKEDTWRERLTAWLAKQRKGGVREPLVTSEVVRLID